MKISIDDYETVHPTNKLLPDLYKFQFSLYLLSIGKILAILVTLIVIGSILFFCKVYIKLALFWLEKQDEIIIAITISILFIIVSLPISVGYIILVLASGYLFGMIKGLPLVIFGANFGLLIAHNLLKLIGRNPNIYKFTQNEMAIAIMHVINGPLCLKIVMCSRLTPIPFGLQNTIFALSNVNGKVYQLASFLGLLPAQIVAVYIGSTLRSMHDVIENNHFSTMTYILATGQLLCGILLIIWIGRKARNELIKVLAEAENASGKTTYSFV